MPFLTIASHPSRKLFSGVAGRYVHGDQLTIGEVELEAGAVVPEHQHPHEQITYVMCGEVEFTTGNQTQILGPGMCATIPANAPHGCRAVTASRVLDIFTPTRDDFRVGQ